MAKKPMRGKPAGEEGPTAGGAEDLPERCCHGQPPWCEATAACFPSILEGRPERPARVPWVWRRVRPGEPKSGL
jgi:hypothetical protein